MFKSHSRLKAFFASLFAFATVSLALANPIDVPTAQKIAEHFFQSNSTLRARVEAPLQLSFALPRSADALEALCEGESVSLRKADGLQLSNYYYVFNRGENQGYVLVAGDDRFEVILGYSLEGRFDLQNAPLYVRGFFEKLARSMENVLTQNDAELFEKVKPIPTEQLQNKSLPASVLPLLGEIQWNQSYPWNNQCPEGRSRKMPVGCVATAMAQVMRYYEWPTRGEGKYSYSEYGRAPGSGIPSETRKHTVDYGATTYDYSKMPKRVADPHSLPREQVDELAKFCYHLGVSVNMSYSAKGSGAYDFDIPRALAENWRYNKAAKVEKRDTHESNVWEVMLRNELSLGRPVLYFGYGSGGGHAFVFDGYDKKGFFHVNWGWGGTSDGYFNMNALDPDAIGIGGGSGGFNQVQSCIFDMTPDREGTSKPATADFFCVNLELETDKGRILKTKKFSSFGYGYPLPYKGHFTLAIAPFVLGADTVVNEAAKQSIDYAKRAAYVNTHLEAELKDFKITEDGLYTVFPMYEFTDNQGKKSWKLMRTSVYPQDRKGTPSVGFATIEVSNGGKEWKVIKNKPQNTIASQLQITTGKGVGSKLQIEFSALGELKVKGAKETTLTSGKHELTLTRKEFSLIGAINNLTIVKAGLTKIELKNCPTLTELNLSDNELTTIDLTRNNALKSINLLNNKLSSIHPPAASKALMQIICPVNQLAKGSEGMRPFIEQLPSRVGTAKGELVLVDLSNTKEANYISKWLVDLAREKGWDVYNFNGSYDRKELYAGDLAVEGLKTTTLRVYPNPAKSFLTIEGAPVSSEIRLLSLEGAVLLADTADNTGRLTLNATALPEGNYLLVIGQEAKPITIRR